MARAVTRHLRLDPCASCFLRWSDNELEAAGDAVIRSPDRVADCCVDRSNPIGRTGGTGADQPGVCRAAFARRKHSTIAGDDHFLTLALLEQHGSGQLTRQSLEDSCHLSRHSGWRCFTNSTTPEFAEKLAFAGFIANADRRPNFSARMTPGRLHFDQRLMTPLTHSELVLSVEARRAIRRIAGAGVAK
jgi:glycerol-3-phosphate O-acyltransferase